MARSGRAFPAHATLIKPASYYFLLSSTETGGGTDASTLLAEVAHADTVAGADALGALVADVASTETPSVVEGTAAVALTNAETTSGTDAHAIALTEADTSSGEDVHSTSIEVLTTETGDGADAGSSILTAAVETTAGAEGAPNVDLSAIDIGGSSEDGLAAQIVTDEDTGHGVDVEVLLEVVHAQETVSGTDTGLIAAALAAPGETGAGTDAISPVVLTQAETASTADALGTLAAAVAQAETPSGVDAIQPIAFSSTEDLAGAEGTPATAFSSSEVGVGVDTALVGAAVAHADMAAGVDVTGPPNLLAGDSGSGADTHAVLGPRTTETAHGADSQNLIPTSFRDVRAEADPADTRGQADPAPRPTLE